MGKPMKEWLRFSVCFWHTWRGSGADIFGLPGTHERPWDGDSLDKYSARVDVHFEFCQKLGIEYYTFHDRDVAPEGSTVAESERMLDEVAAKLRARQAETGIKLLFGTCNLFSHRRYMHGAATNPDPEIVCEAAAQVMKGLEVTKLLGGENFCLWGGRDGYNTILNTNLGLELSNYAAFLKAVAQHADSIGYSGQLLLEPKPREPTTHQYHFDVATTLGLLDQYGVTGFSLNIEANHSTLAGHSAEHDIAVAAARGKLGSIDANRNESLVGWDTDMFPNDLMLATYVMKAVIEQGGLAPGGINFDAKVRRESIDVQDLFISHISAMDCMARGLRAAAALIEDGTFDRELEERYAHWSSTKIGQNFVKGEASLADLAAIARQAGRSNRPIPSGKQEKFEAILGSFAYGSYEVQGGRATTSATTSTGNEEGKEG